MPMNVDVIVPGNVAMDIKDAIEQARSGTATVARLIQILVQKDVLSVQDLQKILPPDYKVRP
jgi:hypothetical protein